MNHSYYNKSNTSLTPGKTKSQHAPHVQLNISKYLRESTETKKGQSLLNLMISQQQQVIASARQLSIDKPIKTSPIESSPHIQQKSQILHSQNSSRSNIDSKQRNSTQFDKLLNENCSLLMRIQELEQKVKFLTFNNKNQLLQMKCSCNRKQEYLVNKQQKNNEIQEIPQSYYFNENENKILKELINRQTSLMHVPSVIQTLSFIE